MKFYTLLTPILFVVSVLLLIFSKVSSIECRVDNKECTQELLEKISTLKGTSFFFGNFEKKLLENQSTSSIYILKSVKKKFPGTLDLFFTQEQVQYLLLTSEKKEYIGESGTILPAEQQVTRTFTFDWKSEEPIIQNTKVMEKYHKKFLAILKILKQESIENANFIWNSDQEILLNLANGPVLIFDAETIETQVKKIDTIIEAKELEEIEEPILEIDMRFDLPVLRTSR